MRALLSCFGVCAGKEQCGSETHFCKPAVVGGQRFTNDIKAGYLQATGNHALHPSHENPLPAEVGRPKSVSANQVVRELLALDHFPLMLTIVPLEGNRCRAIHQNNHSVDWHGDLISDAACQEQQPLEDVLLCMFAEDPTKLDELLLELQAGGSGTWRGIVRVPAPRVVVAPAPAPDPGTSSGATGQPCTHRPQAAPSKPFRHPSCSGPGVAACMGENPRCHSFPAVAARAVQRPRFAQSGSAVPPATHAGRGSMETSYADLTNREALERREPSSRFLPNHMVARVRSMPAPVCGRSVKHTVRPYSALLRGRVNPQSPDAHYHSTGSDLFATASSSATQPRACRPEPSSAVSSRSIDLQASQPAHAPSPGPSRLLQSVSQACASGRSLLFPQREREGPCAAAPEHAAAASAQLSEQSFSPSLREITGGHVGRRSSSTFSALRTSTLALSLEEPSAPHAPLTPPPPPPSLSSVAQPHARAQLRSGSSKQALLARSPSSFTSRAVNFAASLKTAPVAVIDMVGATSGSGAGSTRAVPAVAVGRARSCTMFEAGVTDGAERPASIDLLAMPVSVRRATLPSAPAQIYEEQSPFGNEPAVIETPSTAMAVRGAHSAVAAAANVEARASGVRTGDSTSWALRPQASGAASTGGSNAVTASRLACPLHGSSGGGNGTSGPRTDAATAVTASAAARSKQAAPATGARAALIDGCIDGGEEVDGLLSKAAAVEGQAVGSGAAGGGGLQEWWHELWATRTWDPITGEDVIVLLQHDVTAKVVAERHVMLVMENGHRLLQQIFPRHVLKHMAESFTLAAAAGAAFGGAQRGEGPPAGDASRQGHHAAPPAPPPPPPQQQQKRMRQGSSGGQQQAWAAGSVLTDGFSRAVQRPGGGTLVQDCSALATWHPQVTLLFADVKGFTPMCKDVEPAAVMTMLNELFSRFDALLDRFGVFKVETIGDCYFVAGGLIQEDDDGMAVVRDAKARQDPLHAQKVFMFAKAMLEAAREVRLPTTGEPVSIRVGMHTGPVVSGVVGTRMPRFCLFGDTVNTASRMESTGRPGAIHVSAETHALLRSEDWTPTGGLEVKGKGRMQTYLWCPHAERLAAPGTSNPHGPSSSSCFAGFSTLPELASTALLSKASAHASGANSGDCAIGAAAGELARGTCALSTDSNTLVRILLTTGDLEGHLTCARKASVDDAGSARFL